MQLTVTVCDSGRHQDSIPVPSTERLTIGKRVYDLCAACVPLLQAFFKTMSRNGASAPERTHVPAPAGKKAKREAYARRLLTLVDGGTVHPFELKRRSKLSSKSYSSAQSFLHRHRLIESVNGVRAGVSYGVTPAGMQFLFVGAAVPPDHSRKPRTSIKSGKMGAVLSDVTRQNAERILAILPPPKSEGVNPRYIRKRLSLHPKLYSLAVDLLSRRGYICNVGGLRAKACWTLTSAGRGLVGKTIPDLPHWRRRASSTPQTPKNA